MSHNKTFYKNGNTVWQAVLRHPQVSWPLGLTHLLCDSDVPLGTAITIKVPKQQNLQ